MAANPSAGATIAVHGQKEEANRVEQVQVLKESEYDYRCAYEASRVAEKRYRTLLDFVPYQWWSSRWKER